MKRKEFRSSYTVGSFRRLAFIGFSEARPQNGMHRAAFWLGRWRLLAPIVAAPFFVSDAAAQWFVDLQTHGEEDGTSWEDAFRYIQPAIDAAYAAGRGEVWVAQSDYRQVRRESLIDIDPREDVEEIVDTASIVVRSGVTLLGGFEGSEDSADQRRPDLHTTIIDGDQARRVGMTVRSAYHVVILEAGAVIDGFVIENGRATRSVESSASLGEVGGGVFAPYGGAVIRDCTFLDNSAEAFGGGAFVVGGTIEGCLFVDSRSPLGAGRPPILLAGLAAFSSRVTDCRFERNQQSALTVGAGSLVEGCSFEGNDSAGDGALVVIHEQTVADYLSPIDAELIPNAVLANSDFEATIINSRFFHNEASTGAALVVRANTRVARSRFFWNIAKDEGGAIFTEGDADTRLIIENSVFQYNIGTVQGGVLAARGVFDDDSGTSNTHVAFINSTLTHNQAGHRANLIATEDADVILHNTLVADNGAPLLAIDGSATLQASYSLLQSALDGEGNLEGRPELADPSDEEYPLTGISLGVDAGSAILPDVPWLAGIEVPDEDYSGSPRPSGGAIDMGASEFIADETDDQPIWHVDLDNTSGVQNGTSWATAFRTMRPAIDAAATSGGGEVWVAEGAYTAQRNYWRSRSDFELFNTGSLWIRQGVKLFGGFDGTETRRRERDWNRKVTIIDGTTSRDGEPATNVLIVEASSVVDGFTITGGSAFGVQRNEDGGGAATLGAATFRHCKFVGNRARGDGAGLSVTGGDSVIIECEFRENIAGRFSRGGGLHTTGIEVLVARCAFINNVAGNFGGGATASGTFLDSVFDGNMATVGGGATIGDFVKGCIFRNNYATPSTHPNVDPAAGGAKFGANTIVFDCTFADNFSTGDGGGASFVGISATLRGTSGQMHRCAFSGNVATADGGGLWMSGRTTVSNSVFFDNETGFDGGGTYIRNGRFSVIIGGAGQNSRVGMINCTMVDNQAGNSGGGIWSDESAVGVQNSIVWGNSPEQFSDENLPVAYSIVEGGHNGEFILNSDPMFADRGSGDLRVRPGSPALDGGSGQQVTASDAGDYVTVFNVLNFDRNLNLRPLGSEFDIGAFEGTESAPFDMPISPPTVRSRPTVLLFTPGAGDVAGGDTVTFRGVRLNSVRNVSLGEIQRATAFELSVHTDPSQRAGTVNIVMSSIFGEDVLEMPFVYTEMAEEAVTIESINDPGESFDNSSADTDQYSATRDDARGLRTDFDQSIGPCEGAPPLLFYTPQCGDFGRVQVGSERRIEFLLENHGGSTVEGFVTTETPFHIVSTNNLYLECGASTIIEVALDSNAAESYLGFLNIYPIEGDALSLPLYAEAHLALGRASGLIADSDGYPIVDAVIELSTHTGIRMSAPVSLNGIFVMNDLPIGTYTLRIIAPGFTTTQAEIDIHDGEETMLNQILVPATTTETPKGVVTNATTHESISGARVYRMDPSNRIVKETITAPSGTFEIGLNLDEPGGLFVITSPGYIDETFSIGTHSETDYNILMTPEPDISYGYIEGRITDGITGDALPMANVTLTNGSMHWSSAANIVGHFEFANVPEGHYELIVGADGFEGSATYVSVFAHSQNSLFGRQLRPRWASNAISPEDGAAPTQVGCGAGLIGVRESHGFIDVGVLSAALAILLLTSSKRKYS